MTEWEEHIIKELQRLNENIQAMNEQFHTDRKDVWIELSALKVKSGLYGVIGGALAVVPTLIYFYLQK